MQSVNIKLYVIYRWVALVGGALLLVFAMLCWWMPDILPIEQPPAISYISGASALGVVLYAALGFGRIARKTNYWEATFLLILIQAASVLSVAQTTGQMQSPMLVCWGLMLLTSGIIGIYGTAGAAFLTFMYFLSTTTDAAGVTHYVPLELGLLAMFLATCFVSQIFWRRLYVDQDSAKVAMLSGQLKTNLQQSELLVQSLTDGVLLITKEGQVTLMNPAAARMTGWPVDEGTGAGVQLVIDLRQEGGEDLDPTENPLLQLDRNTKSTTHTLQLISRDKKPMIVSVITSPVTDARTQQVAGYVVVLRDVSVARQEEKQRAEFISTASHEMRTPVAAIEGYLALAMNDKVAKIDAKARTYLEKAHESTQHLGKLFQDLLMSAKAEDGRLTSHPTVVEMGAYVEQLAESFRFAADKKGLLTDFIFGSSGNNATGSRTSEHTVRPLYYVHVDPDRIREVITNLFDNAVKYTPSGKVSVGLTGNNDVVQVYVKDTGPGIPREDVPHLFQKFYRVDNSATRTIGGTGLGLFICRKIVELYKGRIWAESTVGTGSTFYVNLPRLTAQQATDLQRQEAQNTGSTPLTSLTTPV